MRPISFPRFTAVCVAALSLTMLLSGCGTTHPLPKYERPLAHTTFQTVRTTAYTHTESDHLEYGNHNALGGTLHAAGPAVTGPEIIPVPVPHAQAASALPQLRDVGGEGSGGFQRASYPAATVPAYANDDAAEVPTVPATPYARDPMQAPASVPSGAVCGSAAADWSRWPAGTIFRIIPTGQLYKVDDYGWALSGRNTIDLYMPTRATMNAWGVRGVPIQILQWGDHEESLRLLSRHQKYRHIHRMVLELEGKNRAAAALQ